MEIQGVFVNAKSLRRQMQIWYWYSGKEAWDDAVVRHRRRGRVPERQLEKKLKIGNQCFGRLYPDALIGKTLSPKLHRLRYALKLTQSNIP